MSSCKSCGAQLEGTEKFCGACGAPVEHAVEAPIASAPPTPEKKPKPIERPNPPVSKKPQKQTAKNEETAPSTVRKSNLPVYIAAAVLVVVGAIFLLQQGDNSAPVASNQTTTSNNSASSAPAAPAEPRKTSSDAISEYIKIATQANIDGGIAAIAPHRMSVLTCENCAPVMIYCVEPFASVTDLKGRAIRAHSPSAKALVKQVRGNLQLLSFGEVSRAMQRGLIDCSMSGGIVPE